MENIIIYKFIIEEFSQYFGQYIEYPGLKERLILISTNSITILITVLLFLGGYISLKKYRDFFIKFVASLLVTGQFFIRQIYLYSYDTQFSFISLMWDVCVLLYIFYKVAIIFGKYKKTESDGITLGLSIFCYVSLFLTLIGVNQFLNTGLFVFIHFLLSLYLLWEIWNKGFSLINLDITTSIVVVISLVPFLPYIFSPAPPDADITTMSEMLGYLYQGQSLSHVETGVIDEYFAIRYPAGLVSIGFFSSFLLNVRSSEVLLILWIISFVILVLNMSKLGKEFKINPFVISILCINPVMTGLHGLHGGQVQEILTYAIGIGMINSLLQKRYIHAATCLAAALMIHPIVALPFGIVFFYETMLLLLQKKFSQSFIGSILVILPVIYLIGLNLGDQLYISQPQILLEELTIRIFESNIIRYIQSDTSGLYWLIFMIPISFFKRFDEFLIEYNAQTKILQRTTRLIDDKQLKPYFYITFWFLGGCIIDGLFGHTHWGARFQGSFSIIGVWVISAGIALTVLSEKYFKNMRLVKLATISGSFLFLIHNGTVGFSLIPVSSFTTHSNIRMGRLIEEKLPLNILIANIRPPEDSASFGFMARGDTSRNTITARIGEHQIRSGNIVSRSADSLDKWGNRVEIVCPKKIPSFFIKCIKNMNVTHILLDSRPNSYSYSEKFTMKPIIKVGETYLFKL